MLFTILGLSSGYFISNSQHQNYNNFDYHDCDIVTDMIPVRGATPYYRMINRAKQKYPTIKKRTMSEYRTLARKKGIQF